MGILSADQVGVFLAVVEEGSFSAAARLLRRNQSAVSYAISNLEAQLGVELFDRTGNRPKLTPAGNALLGDARKAAQSLDNMKVRAIGLSKGVEAELAFSADAFCPMDFVAGAIADFAGAFPMVRPALHLELVHNALGLVSSGAAIFGLISHPMGAREDLEQFPVRQTYEMAPYAGAEHPLGARREILDQHDLSQYVQLVLGDSKTLSLGQEIAIFSNKTCQTSDIRAQRAFLLAGVGWGFMPDHIVRDDVAAGRIVRLNVAFWPDGGWMRAHMMLVRRTDAAFGPAAAWMFNRMTGA